ncbi:MAG TPA: 6-carboxytetrahydropterin synthase [Nitrospiria bacterium]|nr:6-carboxytetrahydropterin synthase [Nitrospiria bacterium]
MYTVTKQVFFCYGHRLMNYEGKCRHPHGHNGRVEIELQADRLDEKGMVQDFSDIGRAMKGWIDANLDHRMLLRGDDPLVIALEKLGEPVFLMTQNPTAEAIAQLIYEQVEQQGFPVTEVRLWETESSFAAYRGEAS